MEEFGDLLALPAGRGDNVIAFPSRKTRFESEVQSDVAFALEEIERLARTVTYLRLVSASASLLSEPPEYVRRIDLALNALVAQVNGVARPAIARHNRDWHDQL